MNDILPGATPPASDPDAPTAALPVDESHLSGAPGSDASAAPVEEEPTFTGAQLRFLIREFGLGQHVTPDQINSKPKTRVAKGTYIRPFGWMHLMDSKVGLKVLVALALFALGINYLVQIGRGDTVYNSSMLLQPLLLILATVLVFINIIVKWKRSTLLTTPTKVVYQVKAFWPLLILPTYQEARIDKVDAAVVTQNQFETMFNMNSCKLTIDTAAENDKGLHELRGVKDVAALFEDIG